MRDHPGIYLRLYRTTTIVCECVSEEGQMWVEVAVVAEGLCQLQKQAKNLSVGRGLVADDFENAAALVPQAGFREALGHEPFGIQATGSGKQRKKANKQAHHVIREVRSLARFFW